MKTDPNIKFFSILSGGDEKYKPLYDNFIHFLAQVGLDSKHELVSFPDFASGSWQQPSFRKIVYKKLEHTHEELLKGNSVFVSDLDIVFLRDPWDYLMNLLSDYDAVFQQDGDRKCTGFYLAKPTPETLDLFDSSQKAPGGIIGGDACDQGYIHTKLCRKKSFYKNLKIKVLDKNLFPFGKYWYNNHDSLKDPYIVHYNWVAGINNKINKMKEYNHWKVK